MLLPYGQPHEHCAMLLLLLLLPTAVVLSRFFITTADTPWLRGKHWCGSTEGQRLLMFCQRALWTHWFGCQPSIYLLAIHCALH